MNLDDLPTFKKLDPENMLDHIDGLPDQLEKAWELGQGQPLPVFSGLQQILVAGMGGSAIGADLLAAYATPHCPLPIIVHRDYDLPDFAHGPETLVIASSHSGSTEETLSAFKAARERSCRIVAVTTGGELASAADTAGIPVWRFEHKGQPRAAVGFSFGLLLALLARLSLIPEPADELKGTVAAMRRQQGSLRAEVPAVQNPAKRIAGQMMGRWVAVFGAGFLAPVARRWKGQVSEVAKAWGQFEFLPEADHNTMAGLVNPPELLEHVLALFLRSPSDHPRNRLRIEVTRQGFMQEGLNTDILDASGDSPMAHMWTLLHLGDYSAFYLAMAYGVDPTPVGAIEGLKAALK